jgi:hypothetical protein
MNLSEKLDACLRKHPRIFLMLVIILTAFAGMVLLGGLRDVGLIYKAF